MPDILVGNKTEGVIGGLARYLSENSSSGNWFPPSAALPTWSNNGGAKATDEKLCKWPVGSGILFSDRTK